MIRFSNIVTFSLLYLGCCICAIAQPNLTHVDNINAAGQGTLNWELFTPVGAEELVHYEIKVFNLSMDLLSPNAHIVGPDINGVIPIGWVTTSFLYDLNVQGHCFVSEQITTLDGGTTQDASPTSPALCSIHLNAQVGVNPGDIDLEWNSPYYVTGDAAGGDFVIEKLNMVTAVWDIVANVPDSPNGGTYTDNPGPCSNIHIYRIKQLASNGIDTHVSNSTDLETGAGNNSVPTTTHVDVDPNTGLAVVYFDYEVTDETLGYIIYKCTPSGSAEVLQIGDPNTMSSSIPTSLASNETESYRVSAFDCINDDGTPNPNAASDCTSSIFLVGSQIECADKAQLSWNEPFGMDGGVDTYTIEYSVYNDVSGVWSSWMIADSQGAGYETYLHENLNVDQTYRYRIVSESSTGNIARSNNHEITFTYPDAPDAPVISRASVMDDGGVEIVVETDPVSTEICDYQLYRYVDFDNSWIPILDSQSSTMGITLSFFDMSVNTDTKSFTYKCIATNECGAEVGESNIGRTIFLQGTSSEDPDDFTNSLFWNSYEEFVLGVGSYEILRANSRYETATPLESISGSLTNFSDNVEDLYEQPGDFCYTIVALENNSSGGLNGAKSNRVCLTEDPLIWIPTAFSPNGDDFNQYFPWSKDDVKLGFVSHSLPNGEPVFYMTIYSRWGDTIFSSTSIDDVWDGTFNGDPVPDGVYSTVIRILDGAGRWHVISQAVNVVRP